MERPRRQRTTVKLIGITHRHQGSHDSLCAYYAAAMLISTLRPDIEERFDAPRVSGDPLFAHLPRRRGRSVDHAAAEWLASGVRLDALRHALDGAAKEEPAIATRFRYRALQKRDRPLESIRAHIDRGLPCLIGWESRELGSHTALVVGYERYAGSSSRWLRLCDPINSLDAIEWGQIERLAGGRAELIWCARHDGVRPDKLTVVRDGAGAIVRGKTKVERWDPRRSQWQTIVPSGARREDG
jgi:hypothetical protein